MGIDALNSGPKPDFSAFKGAGTLRNFRNSAALSLLPTVRNSSSGLGLGADIYDSVSRQTQGLYSGGRTALLSAYAALGIDNSQKAYLPVDEEEKSSEAEETEKPEEKVEEPVEPKTTRGSRNITEELLKESGYVKPEENPWVVRTDFFA